jgi:hypothetical protein
MKCHDLPTDALLREAVEFINTWWSHLDPAFAAQLVDIASAVPVPQEAALQALETCALGDGALDSRVRHGHVAFVLMRAHGIALQCKETGEVIAFCSECERLHVVNDAPNDWADRASRSHPP